MPYLANINRRARLLLAVGVVAGILFIIGYEIDNYWLRMAAKPLPVLSMALWVATQRPADSYRRLIFGGLLLGMAGDILLEASADTFLLGLIAFLLGHIAYIIAFWRDSRLPALATAAGAYAYGVGAFTFLFTQGELGDMTVPVAAYVLIICTMLWRAAARRQDANIARQTANLALLGALLFTFSDTVLALGRFDTGIDLGRHTVILTYWLGQLTIALSVRRT